MIFLRVLTTMVIMVHSNDDKCILQLTLYRVKRNDREKKWIRQKWNKSRFFFFFNAAGRLSLFLLSNNIVSRNESWRRTRVYIIIITLYLDGLLQRGTFIEINVINHDGTGSMWRHFYRQNFYLWPNMTAASLRW